MKYVGLITLILGIAFIFESISETGDHENRTTHFCAGLAFFVAGIVTLGYGR